MTHQTLSHLRHWKPIDWAMDALTLKAALKSAARVAFHGISRIAERRAAAKAATAAEETAGAIKSGRITTGDEAFSDLAHDLKSGPEGRGPVLSKRLGGETVVQGETVIERLDPIDNAKLTAYIAGNRTVVADGKTLAELANRNPQAIRDMWREWQRGKNALPARNS